MMNSKFLTIAALVLAGGLSNLRASVTFHLGNNPFVGQENILFGADQTGSLVAGTTNLSNTSVSFSSTMDVLDVNSHGAASIDSVDGSIQNLSIALSSGGTFQGLIIDPFLNNGRRDGPATVTVVASDGTFTFQYPCGLDNGQNFLTIQAAPGETISKATIYAPNGFSDLRQIRISGVGAAVPAPEPTTLLLLAGGFLVVGSRRLRLP
ncbi:MAG: PEP-CTERM sorting domain-containing protein [Bryobacteraceae bacterium]